jgi:hypothetical protein
VPRCVGKEVDVDVSIIVAPSARDESVRRRSEGLAEGVHKNLENAYSCSSAEEVTS